MSDTQITYTASKDQIEQGRKFLDHYGIDETELNDIEVIELIQRIQAHKVSKVQVLSRGRALDTLDRLLNEFVPKGMVGEFKAEDDVSIKLAESVGWRVLIDARAKGESSTGAADGKIRIGDQILMVLPQEEYVALKMIKEERRIERRKKRNPKRMAKTETSGFEAPVFAMSGLPSSDDEGIEQMSTVDLED